MFTLPAPPPSGLMTYQRLLMVLAGHSLPPQRSPGTASTLALVVVVLI